MLFSFQCQSEAIVRRSTTPPRRVSLKNTRVVHSKAACRSNRGLPKIVYGYHPSLTEVERRWLHLLVTAVIPFLFGEKVRSEGGISTRDPRKLAQSKRFLGTAWTLCPPDFSPQLDHSVPFRLIDQRESVGQSVRSLLNISISLRCCCDPRFILDLDPLHYSRGSSSFFLIFPQVKCSPECMP